MAHPADPTVRNHARHVSQLPKGTFDLWLATNVDLVAETHDGDVTTLTIRRKAA